MSRFESLPTPPEQQDLPYYAGQPIGFGEGHWMLLMLSVIAAFLLLELAPATSLPAQFLVRLLFMGFPLGTLIWIAGPQTRALFGKITARDGGLAVLAAVMSILAALLAALVVQQFAPVAANPLAVSLADMSVADLLLNLLSTAPQLLGEELLTILPFLALLRLATVHFGLERRWGITVALLISTLLFGAAHLPTYDWNWAQCFGVIGASRLVLTLAYIASRKLWVSTAAHVLTDWTEFTLGFMAHTEG